MGDRASQLLLLLLVEGLSLAPGFAGLVSVVPTDAQNLVLAEKSEDLFLIYFSFLVFSHLVLLSGCLVIFN